MARSSTIPVLTFIFLVLAVIGGGAFFLFSDTDPPEITLSPMVDRVSQGQKITVTATDTKSAVTFISATIRKGAQTQTLHSERFTNGAKSQTVTFAITSPLLKDGSFELELRAGDSSMAGFGRGNIITRSLPMRMDSSPARFSIKTQAPYVRRGGTGTVVYSLSKEVSETGVQVGKYFFPAFKQENGDFISFFAFPYFATVQDFQPMLTALDLAGNKSSIRLPVYRLNRPFRSDVINISDYFLDAAMPTFEAAVPGDMPQLERFQRVTTELRKANETTLLELGRKTAPTMLWEENFLRLPNAAPRAGFGDFRTYMYKSQKLPVTATHLGLDLASLANSEIPAGNSGVVVFAGDLGIYGNLVVVDHGLGLQSLYSHMSEIHVSVGDAVTRGQTLGKTGATGMAVGDHLHFGITVSGLEVSPIEWLDSHWIHDNVTERITSAGGVAPPLTVTQAAAVDEKKPAASTAKPAAQKQKPQKNTKKRK